ncbi:potassium channel family protein [Fulvivirga ligni]|uniref:potassium channel family protein n=1 Tax=Fulvivirga ligni TaxID=2904246 RepID=UPI001F4813EC|nr:potassium channel protein [Fulvivirga ligni]UII22455.1 potassium channel protein [Fulvivirga ligni]
MRKEMPRSVIKLIYATLLFLLSLIIGTVGYIYIEGYNIIDAVYMSIITFATVGFTEVNALSTNGKIFTVCYIVLNLGIFAYTVSVLSTFLFEGELGRVFKNYISAREVNKLKDHVIVCGFGRNGAMACEELHKAQKDFVIIERDNEVIDAFPEEKKYAFISGNATLDEVLLEAGLERASTVITALPSDADNVFITLTAKELNPTINVIAKAAETNSEKKLYRAGASHVVMPDRLGGIHMANLITKPYVIEFLELLSGVGEQHLELEEVSYARLKDEFHHKTIRELDIRQKSGVTIIAFKDDKEGFIFNPASDKKIEKGDVLIILGTKHNISNFKSHFIND